MFDTLNITKFGELSSLYLFLGNAVLLKNNGSQRFPQKWYQTKNVIKTTVLKLASLQLQKLLTFNATRWCATRHFTFPTFGSSIKIDISSLAFEFSTTSSTITGTSSRSINENDQSGNGYSLGIRGIRIREAFIHKQQ